MLGRGVIGSYRGERARALPGKTRAAADRPQPSLWIPGPCRNRVEGPRLRTGRCGGFLLLGRNWGGQGLRRRRPREVDAEPVVGADPDVARVIDRPAVGALV